MPSFATYAAFVALGATSFVLDTAAVPTPIENPDRALAAARPRHATLRGRPVVLQGSQPWRRRIDYHDAEDNISISDDDFWHHHEDGRILGIESDEIHLKLPPLASRKRDHQDDLEDSISISDKLSIEAQALRAQGSDPENWEDVHFHDRRHEHDHDRIYEGHGTDVQEHTHHKRSASKQEGERPQDQHQNYEVNLQREAAPNPFRTVVVHSAEISQEHEDSYSVPLLNINLLDDKHEAGLIHLRVRASDPSLLEGLAGLLNPLSGLFGALCPPLKNLPVVGGLMGIVDSTVSALGGQKLGDLVAGNAVSTSSAFVTSLASVPAGQRLSYMMDASNSTSSPMFLAKLPFSFPTSGCNLTASPSANSSTPAGPVPVAIALPIINNDSIQVVCATYESAPSKPSMLVAQECWNKTMTLKNGTIIAAPQPPNMSQIFAYDEATGTIEPLWNTTATASSGTPLRCAPAAAGGAGPSSPVAGYTQLTAGPANESVENRPADGSRVRLLFTPTSPTDPLGATIGSVRGSASGTATNLTASLPASVPTPPLSTTSLARVPSVPSHRA